MARGYEKDAVGKRGWQEMDGEKVRKIGEGLIDGLGLDDRWKGGLDRT